jgi:hypothetical protein
MDGRAKKALAVLEAGGYFRKALETQWRGGEKFAMRLRNANGHVVAGYGFKTFYALEDAGLLQQRDCAPSSVWPSEWVAR